MRRSAKGFTLVEVTIILLVLVILSAILLPGLERFIDWSRWVRVKEDVGMLAAIIELWKVDNCLSYFKTNGGGFAGPPTPVSAQNRLDLMVGDGNVPTMGIGPYLSTWWDVGPNTEPGGNGINSDTIENQLAAGWPYKSFGAGPGRMYPRPTSPSPWACGFRGAYIQTPVSADPWGNRYMINVAFLGPAGSRNYGFGVPGFLSKDTFVLSAGPDSTVDTPFAVDGVTAVGDDFLAVVSGHSSYGF